MPRKMHNDIARGVRKAHPNYSEGRVEQETNAVMTNIGRYGSGKSPAGGKRSHTGKKTKASSRKKISRGKKR